MLLPELIQSFSEYVRQLFSLNPDDPFKTGGKVVAIAGTLFTVVTTLATKTYPWLRSKLDSRSVSKRPEAEFYTRATIERAVRYYVLPFCQALDPAGAEEPRLVSNPKQKLFDYLDDALEHPTEYNFIILLADSGMGKSSALLNYYVRHVRRWRRKPYNLVLIPLGIPDADERIARVQNKHDTVLFLDALDEDTLAIVDHVERLRILLNASRDFHRVLISCRTQFFSRDEEIPRETGKIKVGSRAAGEPAEYLFHKIYLSPFTDRQVTQYLKRLYPVWQWFRRRSARRMAAKIPHLTARPMLLAHIDDLVQANRQINYSFELYEEMIAAWLTREQGFIQNKEDLRQFSERLAVDLYVNRPARGSERIPKSELSRLAAEWNILLDEWKLSGRSLLNRDVEGNYKFAHRSIMEYLCVHRFVEGDTLCTKIKWTDQMDTFLWESVLDSVNKGTRVYALFRTFHEEERDAKLEFITRLLCRGVEILGKYPTAAGHKTVADVVVQLTTMFAFEQGIRACNAYLYKVEAGNKLRLISYEAHYFFPGHLRGTEYFGQEKEISYITQYIALAMDDRLETPGRVLVHMRVSGLGAYEIVSPYDKSRKYVLAVEARETDNSIPFENAFTSDVLFRALHHDRNRDA